jgi:hypothetical protein
MKQFYLFVAIPAILLCTRCKDADRKASVSEDVSFAKTTFESLAQGNSSVVNQIDWPVLTSMGENVGSSYVAITSGVEQQKFTQAFVTQFATSFRESGGSVDRFTNWRVSLQDSQKTEVAADSTTGVLTLIVSERDKVKRVSSINMIQ